MMPQTIRRNYPRVLEFILQPLSMYPFSADGKPALRGYQCSVRTEVRPGAQEKNGDLVVCPAKAGPSSRKRHMPFRLSENGEID